MNYSPKEEIDKGLKALETVINDETDFYNAFSRNDIGLISLIYGTTGDNTKNFKGGYGIAHIIAKRDSTGYNGLEVVKKLIEVIVKGDITRTDQNKQTITIEYDNYRAILSLRFLQNTVTWLLTGFYTD